MSAWPPFFTRLPDPDFMEGQSRLHGVRGNSGITQVYAPPHNPPTRHPNHTESPYPPSYAARGFVQQHAGGPSPSPPVFPHLQHPQRADTESSGAQLYPGTVNAFPRSAGNAWQDALAHDRGVLPSNNTFHDSSPPCTRVQQGMNSEHPRLRPPGLGHPRSRCDTTPSHIGAFASLHQSWDRAMTTGFVPQPGHSRPSQIVSLPSSPVPPRAKPHGTKVPPYIQDPEQRSTEDDEDEFSTFLCEWMDEHGLCNMQVSGDRVSMSQHLSRSHDVVGDEKSQRPCLWRGCTETMNKGSLARHVVSRHLRAGASCGFCSKVYSRLDVVRRHIRKCKVANASAASQDAEW